jgi:hypothetical protein
LHWKKGKSLPSRHDGKNSNLVIPSGTYLMTGGHDPHLQLTVLLRKNLASQEDSARWINSKAISKVVIQGGLGPDH